MFLNKPPIPQKERTWNQKIDLFVTQLQYKKKKLMVLFYFLKGVF